MFVVVILYVIEREKEFEYFFFDFLFFLWIVLLRKIFCLYVVYYLLIKKFLYIINKLKEVY